MTFITPSSAQAKISAFSSSANAPSPEKPSETVAQRVKRIEAQQKAALHSQKPSAGTAVSERIRIFDRERSVPDLARGGGEKAAVGTANVRTPTSGQTIVEPKQADAPAAKQTWCPGREDAFALGVLRDEPEPESTLPVPRPQVPSPSDKECSGQSALSVVAPPSCEGSPLERANQAQGPLLGEQQLPALKAAELLALTMAETGRQVEEQASRQAAPFLAGNSHETASKPQVQLPVDLKSEEHSTTVELASSELSSTCQKEQPPCRPAEPLTAMLPPSSPAKRSAPVGASKGESIPVPVFKPEPWQSLRGMKLPPKRPEDNYEISDNGEEDSDADEDTTDRTRKHVPAWCDKYLEELSKQADLDPDTIFGSRVPTCDLDIVFTDELYATVGNSRPKRHCGSSRDWRKDRLTHGEIHYYKNRMGHTRGWNTDKEELCTA